MIGSLYPYKETIMQLIKDLFLVLYTMLVIFLQMPVTIYKWYKREGWKETAE
ncbi:hypothetical protein VPHD530_0014 [Vibrio phage D530]